ncbi:hypothetical protein HAX54_029932 [Datura stramonium]|uniref:Uncharacterized protein n=1 Tax=Datura stramonium TaxID=4076 RepID=A0ABS8V835_DATST|nr:hypothetical protein [Datura stramonium]
MADDEIKNMICDLTKRLGSLKHVRNKAAPGDSSQSDDDDHGTRIITLAGTNVGASMRGGSYCTNDPGVHLDISDNMEHHEPPPRGHG